MDTIKFTLHINIQEDNTLEITNEASISEAIVIEFNYTGEL